MAGDTVASLIALSLASGITMMVDSVKLANIAVWIVIRNLGTSMVTKDELKHQKDIVEGCYANK
ncbi:MAG: hypothetical protein O8C62_11570 [Candidatus Methanoperedens sp.]|nr:hypothetical protein [Candidatus Methanoperedens sp.]